MNGSSQKMSSMKDVPREDMLVHGHGACPGCGYVATAKNIIKMLGPNTMVYVPSSCLVVFGALYPYSAWKIPYLFTAFGNTGAVITGMKAALKRRGVDAEVVGMAGDGGSFDIGLQALSGAAYRNEDVIYVCLDNEAFMNTGIQRSSATPFGAWTTTSPIGDKIRGNRNFKKDIAKIIADHDVPYVATLSISHFTDFVKKVQRAKEIKGFRFLHCLTPCIPGWRIEPAKGVSITRLAVETGMWTLYEIDEGKERITYKPKELLPVKEYLSVQGRFRQMSEQDIQALQKWVCDKWTRNYGEEPKVTVCKPGEKRDLLHDAEDPIHGV